MQHMHVLPLLETQVWAQVRFFQEQYAAMVTMALQ